jgi:hypothetical protein
MSDYVGDCPGVLRFSPAPPNGFPQCDYTPQQPLLPPGPHHPDQPHTVPEPDTLVLVGLALAAAIALKKRRK